MATKEILPAVGRAAGRRVRAPIGKALAIENSAFVSESKPDQDALNAFDPVAKARSRTKQLPPSRYQFRPPRYYRGPLHPHQPPAASDPASREFIPGPFSFTRLQQTYESTLASDLLSLTYTHTPFGFEPPERTSGLREWVGPSPYFKGRPMREPRGTQGIRPSNRPTTFRNVVKLKKVVVHTMASKASTENDSGHLHVAGMVLQAITNARCESHQSKKSVTQWGLKKSKYVSVTAELTGESMNHFVSKLVELVLPRIKDYKGIAGTSGDRVGNISFGLTPEDVVLFPEVEVNYDMYPPKMIPGCHVHIQTTATTDKEARLLLASLGFPFHGRLEAV